MGFEPGDRIAARYQLIRQLGEGGAGTTFLARDLLDDVEVALKLVHADGDAERAFGRELLLLRGLAHPRLARLYDHGYADDGGRRQAFYTAALVDGEPLHRFAGGKRWQQLCAPLCDALAALGFLHALGIRHGDVKPDNVMVHGGRGTLIDLSCAQPLGEPAQLAGTPGYLAPELLSGQVVDQRADLFAVGVTLAELCGVATRVPAKVKQLSARLTSPAVAARPADVGEVLEALGGKVKLAPVVAQPPELVGRAPEMAAFDELLSAWLAGRQAPRKLLVVGDDGVGRTRLLEEMKWQAQLRCTVVEGRASSPRAVASMLQRAAGDAAPRGDSIAALLAACDEVRQPTVLLLDDADLLDERQRDAWRALWHTRAPASRVAMVCSVRDAAAFDHAGALLLQLAPLKRAAVASWLGGRVSSKRLDAALRATGGYAAELRQLTQQLSTGALAERELTRAVARASMSERRENRLEALDADGKRVLAMLAAAGGPLDVDTLDATAETLARLASDGWLVSEGTRFRLARRADAATMLEQLPAAERRKQHHALADRRQRAFEHAAADEDAARHAASAVRHRLLAGQQQLAAALLKRTRRLQRRLPDSWCEVGRTLAASRDDEASLLEAAKLLEAAGRVDEALPLLARLLRRRPGPQMCAAIRLTAGAAYLRAGDLGKAKRALLRALPRCRGATRARALDLLSRVHLKRAAYDEAAEAARAGLACAGRDDDLSADLHDDLGVAESYRGAVDAAREQLAVAERLHEQGQRPRAQARSASYRALAAYRAGDTQGAAQHFRQALELAEACDAADLVCYAAQNLGTALHQSGDLGAAMDSYRRGLRMASALGDVSSEAALRCNMAKLFCDLGLLQRAADAAAKAERVATRAAMPLIAATSASVAGEVSLLVGDAAQALEHFERARAGFGDAPREQLETALHVADAQVALGDGVAAKRTLEAARERLKALDADDLAARAALVEAHLLISRGAPERAIGVLEPALKRARRAGQRELEAEIHACMGRACDLQGAHLMADEHDAHARQLWERTATSLPAELTEPFWQHPSRRRRAARPSQRAGSSNESSNQPAADPRQLERLLAINKKLNSSLQSDQVLAWTIDAALELTGAERGFVILDRQGELAIAVARNIDTGAADGSDELHFSKGIAFDVIRSASPVVTVDARQDRRFERQQSVHAMRLTSVLSVPIVAPAGVIGALYLDHRFKRGLFQPQQVELLTAFADQVAIALTNARLHQQLAERTAQLDELLRGQAERIDDLSQRVKSQQQLLELSFDYSNIVGRRSAVMQRVLRTLERVIDTDVPVLLQGESGTGKELIAKAIHYNGSRKDGPLVTINCGAVPENLLESELFGHVRGAFTGASEDRAGLFVAADGGTIFLDELGEMPAAMQVKLLRVLQEQEVRPIGGKAAQKVNVRVVAATNRNLRHEVERGRFREDLFYRIGVVEVDVPPLRERLDDLPELAEHLLARAAERTRRPVASLAPAALRALLSHDWPGNVRELDNVLTRALLMSEDGVIGVHALELSGRSEPRTRDQFESEQGAALLAMLRETEWNVSETARRLGVSRPTIYRRMHRLGIVQT